MQRTYLLAGSLVVLLALALTAAVEAGDKAKLKGTWEVTTFKLMGKEIELPPGAKLIFSIDGDKISVDDGKMKKEGTIKLDETKKPKEFEIFEGTESKMKGIFELTGDTLKMAGGMGATPTGFDDPKGMTMVLKRVKK